MDSEADGVQRNGIQEKNLTNNVVAGNAHAKGWGNA